MRIVLEDAWRATCRGCGFSDVVTGHRASLAKEEFKARGWGVRGNRVFCPDCMREQDR